MNVLPQIEKISVFRADTDRVISKVKETGPVLLMQRSDPAVVLVSPDYWDNVAQRLSYLERIIKGDAAKARIDAGDYATVEEVDEGFRAIGVEP